jgi:large subunit ribosomal protein L21e
MGSNSKGARHGTRFKLSKGTREKPINISIFLQKFKEGDRATIKINPSFHGGAPHPRFNGLSGLVEGKQGNCYIVRTRDGNKEKSMIVHPVHLRKL